MTVELARESVRVPESAGLVEICATKDLQTAVEFNITVDTVDVSAIS